jgi:uncharacterized protein YjiS (DUF1127 family)
MSASVTSLRIAVPSPPARRGIWARLQAALAVREARRQLAEMDDRLLADIGASRADAVWEASRRLWE